MAAKSKVITPTRDTLIAQDCGVLAGLARLDWTMPGVATAAAGIIVGTVSLTGIGLVIVKSLVERMGGSMAQRIPDEYPGLKPKG